MNDRLSASWIILLAGVGLIVWYARLPEGRKRSVMGAFFGEPLVLEDRPSEGKPFPGVKPFNPKDFPLFDLKPDFSPIPGTVVPWGVIR